MRDKLRADRARDEYELAIGCELCDPVECTAVDERKLAIVARDIDHETQAVVVRLRQRRVFHLDTFDRGGDAIGEVAAFRRVKQRDDADGKCIPVLFQTVERAKMRAYVLDERVDREGLILLLVSRARETEDAEMRREAGQLRKRLRTHATRARREFHDRGRIPAQPAGAFERKHVRRIGDHLGASSRRNDPVLARRRYDRAHAERRERRQLDRLESFGVRE